ncbi:hypothetical protein MED121_16384 [Marinomonas sp. MED121]|nr:hypothetical protein MED121_16384 [Marinomonas sp. MED121]
MALRILGKSIIIDRHIVFGAADKDQ